MLPDWGFRTASRMARDAPHRRATRSWPKTPALKHGGSRLHESLLRTFGIRSRTSRGTGGRPPLCRRDFQVQKNGNFFDASR